MKLEMAVPVTFVNSAAAMLANVERSIPDTDTVAFLLRAIIAVSVSVNVFFLRGIYKKITRVDHIDKIDSQIRLIARVLAAGAAEKGQRATDPLVLALLDEVKQGERK